MKILLLGKNGMLGSAFFEFFSNDPRFDLSAFDRDDLDVTDYDKLNNVVATVVPDFIINCVGYTAVDDAEKNRDIAFVLNGDLVGYLSKFANEVGATLIHFSTDYVFDGKSSDGYNEDDIPAPLSVYAESKAFGESELLNKCNRYYLIRTSWLFGPNGKNFVDTMVRLGSDRDELRIVNDQIGSPTYTFDLVDGTVCNFITNDSVLDFGIYHMTNTGTVTWFDFAKEIFSISGLDVAALPITTEEFNAPANRPKCSILIDNKLKFQLPSWKDALSRYLG